MPASLSGPCHPIARSVLSHFAKGDWEAVSGVLYPFCDVSCRISVIAQVATDAFGNALGSNPPAAPTLNEVLRLIASFGGFLMRKSDGEPGVPILWKGLRKIL
jgi:hypothetical protein